MNQIFEGGKTQVFIKYISSNIFIIDQNLSVFEGYRKFNNMFVFVRDYFWPEQISVLKYKHNLFSKRYFQSIQMQTPLAKKGCYFIRILYPNISVFTILKPSCKSEIWNVCSCYLATLNRRFIPYLVSNRRKNCCIIKYFVS